MSGMLAVAPAFAAPKLMTFVEANGCTLRSDERTVKRLQEITAQGAVVWEGQCKDGLTEGKGVLRQEGAFTVDGKTKKFAYFLTGSARKGLREGQWKRETFERFVDSPRFYTSASTLNYVDGVAKGKPQLLAITGLDQLTPGFRQLVMDAQRDAKPANEALMQQPPVAVPLVAVSPKPEPSVAAAVVAAPPLKLEAPPAATAAAAAPKAEPARTAPPVAAAAAVKPPTAATPKPATPAPRLTASSQYRHYGPEGLLTAAPPGWHSQNPPDYPEWIMVDFQVTREIRKLGMLAQDNSLDRAPKIIRIESSDDGKAWRPQIASQISCAPNAVDGWLNMILRTVAKGRYLKIVILQNCGDPNYVTIRGLRFE